VVEGSWLASCIHDLSNDERAQRAVRVPSKPLAEEGRIGTRELSAQKVTAMVRGSKEKYTAKQRRKARHIEKGYEERGTSETRAARIAWATVNKLDGGGKKSGSGRKRAHRSR
jgi:hypothetical protein